MVKVIPPAGKVELIDKLLPSCQKPAEEFYAFTRATIDIKPWKDKLASLPESFWEDEHQDGNVKLVRPAHDAWGIQKIIFTFCDDFLMKILDLPFSQQPEWRNLILPVFQAIGVDEKKVVRCLLARMPPGVKIPVHHDTGMWVQHTHRVHLAIESGDEVEFWVGHNENSMQQYLFEEGAIVELNNQAKHAVFNGMTDRHRVHLIFDYVEDFPLPVRHVLQPGEAVFQTRRSIDLAQDVRNFKVELATPRFLIIGAQKSGTTSMYEYICQHPLVVRGKRRETHYFDWRFNHTIAEDNVVEHRKQYLKFFEGDLLKKHPSLVTGESTPSYLLHADIVLPRLKAMVPWTNLIVMLRNPVDRAFSQFQMVSDPTGTPEQLKVRGRSAYVGKTFEMIVDEEIAHIVNAGITPASSYQDFQAKLLRNLPMDHGGHSIVTRGLYAFQLAPYLEQWPAEQLKICSMKDIQGDVTEVQQVVNEVFHFLELPPSEIADVAAKNTRKYDPLSPEVKAKLAAFYQPYNERLYELVGRNFGW